MPMVLYVPTCFMGNRFYVPHNRSCAYYRFLCRVTDILSELRAVDVVLKIHQTADNCFNPIPERLQARRSPIRVIASGPITPWLERAHLVIFDLPCTSMMEALALGKRCLVYWNQEAFTDPSLSAQRLLEQAVMLELDEAAFLDRLRHLEAWAGYRPPVGDPSVMDTRT